MLLTRHIILLNHGGSKIKRRDVWCMIIPTTNLVCVLFDPVIPTSSFNLFKCSLYLFAFFLLMILPMLNVCMYVLHVPVRYRGHVYDVMSLCARMLM